MKYKSISDLQVHETEDYLFLNKPAGISSLNDRAGEQKSMLTLIKEASDHYQLCHRLDKETSGILLVSKHNDAYKFAANAFEKRNVEKTYLAISKGVHQFDDVLVELPIAISGRGNVRIDTRNGKPSATYFNTLKIANGHTLIECKPVTGRMHQIRIHLKSLNAPICADDTYGGEYTFLSQIKRKFKTNKTGEEKPLLSRVALHAYLIQFEGPDGQLIQAGADMPKDMEVFWKQLNKW